MGRRRFSDEKASGVTLFVGVLGPLILRCDGRELPQLNAVKARALIAYLGANAPQTFLRDHLARLLWPEQILEAARHNLSQTLNILRHALGPAAASLNTSYRMVGLRGVTTDLEQLQAFATSDDPVELKRAAKLIRGPFLADAAAATNEFEEWLRPENARVLALKTAVLMRLVAAAEVAGAFNEAVIHATQLVQNDPYSDHWQRVLLRALAKANLRQEAITQFNRFADELWEELKVEPEEATRELARQIARDEFNPRIEADGEGKASPAAGSFTAAVPGAAPLVAWPSLLPRLSVAVAPLQNRIGDTSVQYLVDGFGDDLVTDLLNKGRGLSPVSVFEARVPALGAGSEFLSADYLITGGAQRASASGMIRFNLRIQKAGSREFCFAHRYDLPIDALPERQTEVTARIARTLNFLLIREASRRALDDDDPIEQLDVITCLARGMAAINDRNRPDNVTEAYRWYLRALAIDPKNVDALAGFALTCQQVVGQPWWADETTMQAALAAGRSASAAALSLASRHPLANGVSGMLASAGGELERAGRYLARAIEADPRYVGAHAFDAYNRIFLGRAGEATTAIEAAMRLDRTDRATSIMTFFAGFAYLAQGRHEDAVTWLRWSRSLNPDYGSALLFYTVALALSGRTKDAETIFSEFLNRYPGYTLKTFRRQWLSRSRVPEYQRRIVPLFDRLRLLGLPQ